MCPMPGPRRTADGWVFDEDGLFSDPELNVAALHEVYSRQKPGFTGNLTVPVLWDREIGKVVSNESADIVRMLGFYILCEFGEKFVYIRLLFK